MTEAMHLILIFKDDQAIQNVLPLRFEANGFRVVIADTAVRGENDARLHRPDIVVVDLGLPDPDGLAVTTAIPAGAPVPGAGGGGGGLYDAGGAGGCRWACSNSATSRSTSAGASPAAETDAMCA